MKKPDKIVFERYLYNLSIDELRTYLQKYDEKNKTKAYQEITKVKQAEIQTKIEALYPNITCPYCKSTNYVKNGFYDGFQRYKCKNCNSSYTLVTDTFMEGTNWTWEVWVKLLQMTLGSMSLDEMIDTLEKDYKLSGISRNTVFLARHKLLHAMSLMPKPTLTGIVQVDETFFRENQKGTRTDLGKQLINVIPNILPIRLPRRGYSPSRLGTMGNEYATVVCAVDNHHHAVSVVAGFGKVDPKVFTDCFDNHFADITYLCTDGSPIYKDYCILKSIPHYVKPAHFVKYLLQKGYISGVSSKSEEAQIRELYLNNKKIAAQLYADGVLDYIETANSMPFNEFCKIKYEYGLNLSRVNAFHNYLKLHLERIMTGVATKYLPTYVDAYTFMYNWKHDHKTTLSSMKDAEIVLVELIKNRTAFTLNDLKQKDFFIAPQPTGRYIALLADCIAYSSGRVLKFQTT